MFSKDKIKNFKLSTGGIELHILESGNIKEIRKNDIQITQLKGNNLESSLFNIYLKIEYNNKKSYYKLIGNGSSSKYTVYSSSIKYIGEIDHLKYEVELKVIEDTIFTTVNLSSNVKVKVTVYYGIDVAIAPENAVRNNEAYVCQYIDHKAFSTSNGYVIGSRQNQGTPHYLQTGSLTKNIAFSTDGYQFFKKEYKLSNFAEALKDDKLVSEVYQYEFAYIALQSQSVDLESNAEFVFYSSYIDCVPEILSEPKLSNELIELYDCKLFEEECFSGSELDLKFSYDDIYNSLEMSDGEINELYPKQVLVEYFNNKTLSFFTEEKSHVILQQKELLSERPSGHIMLSGNNEDLEKVLANTTYMFGVFSSQIVCGNTSFNKLNSNIRNSLNIQKYAGLRIFIKLDNKLKLLNLPAVYELGLNYSKWIYKLDNDIIEVTVYTDTGHPKTNLIFKSLNNITYDFLITNFLTMSQNEYDTNIEIVEENGKIIVYPSKDSMVYQRYQDFKFTIVPSIEMTVNNDSVFYEDNQSRNDFLLTMTGSGSNFELLTIAYDYDTIIDDFNICKNKYLESHESLLNNFNLSIDNDCSDIVEGYNVMAYWYAHNALVHYASPHGLEQYNGAAWGTRDICQGPIELFMATQKFDKVRTILLDIFRHQFIENGNWPQWFMFDRYSFIQQHESHGDIIVWPARTLAIYLNCTKDYSILEETVSYTSMQTSDYTEEKYTILEHLKKEINNIIENFIPSTFLSCYGGGDWDDTLQPAKHELAKTMVSGWTVALTYEMLSKLGEELTTYDDNLAKYYLHLAEKILCDYRKYIIIDDIPAGFVVFDDNITPIIHPSDKVTGIKYRLLPMNRGIISEIFNDEEVENILKVIDNNLKHPDGVRLMDNTVKYNGGITTYFTRAETAANFGREIGLQYCHAHIRYCEALAKLGLGKDLFNQLSIINSPITNEMVSNANIRQRNVYYSSSDGDFSNRYDAMTNYNKLRTGDVAVKAGWRIYSSGPGIYLNQVICNMLGIRISGDNVIIDPILPAELSGLKFNYSINNKKIIVTYIKSTEKLVLIDGKEIDYLEYSNKYRCSGYLIGLGNIKEGSNIVVYY